MGRGGAKGSREKKNPLRDWWRASERAGRAFRRSGGFLLGHVAVTHFAVTLQFTYLQLATDRQTDGRLSMLVFFPLCIGRIAAVVVMRKLYCIGRLGHMVAPGVMGVVVVSKY